MSAHLAPLAAQSVDEIAEECAASNPVLLTDWCREVALAVEAGQAAVGLATSGAASLPGTSSTLGRRLGSMPRISAYGRLGFAAVSIPDILDASDAPAPERDFAIPSFQGGVAVGIFDGFSLAPSVGGILSLDGVGTGSFLFLPGDDGFDEGITAWGLGVRVGLLRESFTLPGVTVSWARTWQDRFQLGEIDDGDQGEISFDLSTTSFRATVGKDLFGISLGVGAGWDEYSSDFSLAAEDPSSGLSGSASADDFESDRSVFYGSVGWNFLVLELTGELGWASGFDQLSGRGGGFDPEGGTLFGGLSLRLTF